ncbi:polynucleotidyl transferase ribonuclease H fold [Trifolium medium]|uniref:Polynucleotidyl transferase ribonuclease H fold n=1 Tax=Trifolium medium TaxID=97028 RepID=A0A392PKS6_9FABA|nr:polynucleotidyl transferase ribonuclease H fold [Trifolium medium]
MPIWDNRWLSNGSIIRKPLNLIWMMDNMTVSDLLLDNEKCWNTQLVHDIFGNDTATRVLKTPLINSVATDKIVWRYEKNGIYYVKSVYRYCVEDAIDSSHLTAPGQWSLIWKAKAPPKI